MINSFAEIHPYFFYSIIGTALAFPTIQLNIRLASQLGLIDLPKARGLSQNQVPIVGAGLVACTLLCMSILFSSETFHPCFFLTSLLIALMGSWDDRKSISAAQKLMIQILLVIAVLYFDPHLEKTITARFGAWGNLFAAFFLIALMNAINFIDGIDGLAGLVILLGGGGFLLLSYQNPALRSYFILAALIIGMMLPFLYINIVKRNGFLGNVGSYFYGYLLGVLYLSVPVPIKETSSSIFFIIGICSLCFLVPFCDASSVVIARILTARSPFQPDKNHLHHRLLRLGIKTRSVLFFLVALEILGLVLGFAFSRGQFFSSSYIAYFPLSLCFFVSLFLTTNLSFIEKISLYRFRSETEKEKFQDNSKTQKTVQYQLKNQWGVSLSKTQKRKINFLLQAQLPIHDLSYFDEKENLWIVTEEKEECLKELLDRIEETFQKQSLQLLQGPVLVSREV